jgi:hypothetical protein
MSLGRSRGTNKLRVRGVYVSGKSSIFHGAQRCAVRRGFIALFVVSATVGCHQPRESEGLLGARARTPAPSGTGSCDFDLAGDKADTVFFTLGLLNEYNGRGIVEDSDRVEGFYCNETNTARLFRRYLGRLAQEQGLNPAVREETVQQCLVSYYSKPIADRLNSCYRYQMTDQRLAQASDGTYRRTADPSLLASRLFARDSISFITEKGLSDEAFFRRRALAYLAGAWARYGRGNEFVFANAHDKATLVEGLLSDLGCSRISLESTYGLVPQANIVRFQPTDEVTEWLRKTW